MTNSKLAHITKKPAGTDGLTVKHSKIQVACRNKNKFIPKFILVILLLNVVSLAYLKIDWVKLVSRVPQMGVIFFKLGHLDLKNIDLIGSAMLETISIAVLSLLYSLILGILFGMLSARNIIKVINNT